MSQDPDAIRADIERTRAELSSNVDQLTDEANPKTIARRRIEDVRQTASGLKDRVLGSSSDGPDFRDRVDNASQNAHQKMQGNPLAAGLIAFGVGLLVAGLIPSSSTEQEAAAHLKDRAEPLKEELAAKAKEVGQNLQAPAQDAVSAVRATATGAAETIRNEGQAAATDVKQQAQESREAVQQQ